MAKTKDLIVKTKHFVAKTKDFMMKTKDFVAKTKDFMVKMEGFLAKTKDFLFFFVFAKNPSSLPNFHFGGGGVTPDQLKSKFPQSDQVFIVGGGGTPGQHS